MKAEITQKGVTIAGKPVSVGEVLDVPGATLPGWLVGKARIIDKTPRVAVTNPAEGATLTAPGPERQILLGEIAVGMDAEGFGSDGIPDVRAINRALPQGEARFTASERDDLWPGIADPVMARRKEAN